MSQYAHASDCIPGSILMLRLHEVQDKRITAAEKDAVEACLTEVRKVLGLDYPGGES